MYKLFVFAPDNEEVISSIITQASKAGAGIIGNYNCCAFITKGFGNWKSEEGAHPTTGEVGVMSREPMARIEMICPKNKASVVKKAIKSVHPFEEPEMDFVELIVVD